jgi:glycosyltransferase involved in cell wall biosynthesis
MNILHIDMGRGWRGGQQQVLFLMEGLRLRGHHQTLATPAGSPIGEATRARGFTIQELSASGRVSLKDVKALRQTAPHFHVIHAHDSHSHSLAWIAGRIPGQDCWPRLVVSRRVAFPIGRLSAMKYASADAFIAVSEHVRRELLNAKVPAAKTHVIYDAIPVSTLIDINARRCFRSRLNIADDNILLGTLTTLAPEKRVQEQVDALQKLPSSVQLCVGRPASDQEHIAAEQALLDYAAHRGLTGRFRIIPLSDDIDQFLGSLDIFVYLSHSEGLGSAILLAMAHSLPVVASKVGGIPEIVRHNETGILVDDLPAGENFSMHLQSAISALIKRPALRAQIGAAAAKFVQENATTEIMAEKTEVVYQEALSAKDYVAPSSGTSMKGVQP